MNEKQKRLYGLLRQLYFENKLEYPEDANNMIHAVHRVISYVFYVCDDEDFIPALEAFLRELKRMDSEITTEQAWEKIAEDKGCTIEKEPVWIVKINEKLYFCRFTDKYFEENSDEPTYSESGNPELVKKFTDKAKAEAVATLVDGEVEEWSE